MYIVAIIAIPKSESHATVYFLSFIYCQPIWTSDFISHSWISNGIL